MSARLEKLKRRAARAELGISKAAQRAIEDFEAQVRAKRHQMLNEDTPIVSRQPRRATLAWIGLGICLAILAAIASGGLR